MSSKSGRPERPWPLALRLTAWYAGSSFALVLLATGFLYWVLTASLDRENDEVLADQVHILRKLLRERPEDTAALAQEVEWEWSARQYAQLYVRILDESGATVMETPGMGRLLAADDFPPAAAGDEGPGMPRSVRSRDGSPFRVLSVRGAVGTPPGAVRVVQVAQDRAHEEDILAGYRWNLLLVLGVSLGVCTLAGYHIARRGIRPVERITATARRIRSTTLDERLAVAGLPAELAALAETFNEMLDRLEESFARLARFSADIAHELRTPLNNMRGEAEVALGRARSPEEYREVLGSCLEECVRLSQMIDSLLFLARAEHPETRLRREPLDVGHELRAIRDFFEAAANESGVALTVQAAGELVADLDRGLFQRAVGNLVENALTHTPRGGTVSLCARREGGAVCVQVADTGCGIAGEHLPHLFDRFYRVDSARSGATGGVGLGLAIVKSIAGLHGGSVEIASTVGRGTRVSLLLPARMT